MLFSREWLASYVRLPDDAETARRLTFGGFAVERVEAQPTDAVFDIDITANRPDCMCHLGLARELAVLLGETLQPPVVSLAEDAEPVTSAASVTIEDAQRCPRFVVRVVRGVRIGPSPAWLQARLTALGLRPVNNVVDVTNFVLWETGQPLHAYDLARLDGHRIVVRAAHRGERLRTLDGNDRELAGGELIIADASRPIGLGGVMGGEDTEVSPSTTDVLIEGALFDRRAVRATSRRFALHTDASHRFERGADPEAGAAATARAAALIQEVAGGRILAGAIDVRSGAVPRPGGRLELARLDRFAGVPTPAEEVVRILRGLGFEVTVAGDDSWDVVIPSWRLGDFAPRQDGTVYPADLYEEILRVTGFERIPPALPAIAGADGPQTPRQLARGKVRAALVASGYAEAINFSFLDPEEDALLPVLRPGTAPLRLTNPLSERYAVMRRSLAANLLASARLNRRRGAAAVRLFEVGGVFFPGAPGSLPDEPEHVAFVGGGRVGEPWDREVELDLFDLKGAVERVTQALGVAVAARPAALPGLFAGSGADLIDEGGNVVGWLGQVADEPGSPLFAGELSLTLLEPSIAPRPHTVVLPSRFPSVSADFTFTHARTVEWSAIAAAIAGAASTELSEFHLKARYGGPGVPAGAINTTIAFLYNVADRSLTQEEVNVRQQALAGELERRFGWRG